MPIFGSKKEPEPAPVIREEPKRSLFHKKEPEPAPVPVSEPRRSGNFFNRRRSSSPSTRSPSSPSTTTSRTHNLLHRDRDDPSILAARKHVEDAEAAEREADRALMAARAKVNQAREEVKRLEKEAEEEARRARLKQKQAGEISARAKPLGRHG